MKVVDWRAAQIVSDATRAGLEAVNELTQAAATRAESSHWWQSQTGRLERETISEPAHVEGSGTVSGKFGTTKRRGFYGLFLEYEQPFLRPAADEFFPQLGHLMAEKLATKT
jgi:hypothetical protein